MDVQFTRLGVGHIKPRWLKERAHEDIIVPPEARLTIPVTVLHLHGPLDGSSYETLIETAQAEIENGTRRMIVDLEGVETTSSAGVLGLYVVGALLEGVPLIDLDGYGVMGRMRDAIDRDEVFPNLRLAAPTEKVARVLQSTGLDRVAPTLPSLDDAISAFPDD